MNLRTQLTFSAMLLPLIALMPICVAVIFIATSPDFESNPAVHWVLEISSAVMLGLCAYIVHRTADRPLTAADYLLIAGLICAAVLEAAHGLMILNGAGNPDLLRIVIPWGWLPSRVVLAFALILAIGAGAARPAPAIQRPVVYGAVVVMVLFSLVSLCVLTVSPMQLPEAYKSGQLVHRPSELLPAALFFIALVLQLRLANWRTEIHDYMLLLAIAAAVVTHSLLMPFAPADFTNWFAAAGLTKAFSYLLLVAALVLRARDGIQSGADQVRIRHKAIFDTASDAIVTFDDRGIIDSFNPAATRMFGYSESEAVGSSVLRMVPERLWPVYERYLARTRSKKSPPRTDYNDDTLGVRKDGTIFPMESALNEVRIGRHTSFTAIVRDITGRKAEQVRLQEVSNRLTLALESASLGLWEQDLETGKLTWNNRMFELYERNPRQGAPDPCEWLDQTMSEDRDACFIAHEAAVRDNTRIDQIYRTRLPGERIRWIRANGMLVEGDGERPRRLVGVNQDITDDIEHMEELETARRQADDANRAKSAFLATMSHEIRTPLNGVIGLTEVLRTTTLDDHQADVARLIQQSADSLLGIIEDVLDLSKIEAGKLEIDPTTISPADIVRDLCSMLTSLATKSQVTLSTSIDPAIPPALRGDGQRLRQILTNLINNAIKFTNVPEREGLVQVIARCVSADDDAVVIAFSVTDNGIGMDRDTLSRLFEPFTQADASTSRRFGGTGLGLTISQRLAQLMGGEITVTSTPGEGTTFVATLPFAPTADVIDDPLARGPLTDISIQAQRDSDHCAPSRAAAIADNALILVAEDNATNRAVLEYQLHELGYQADFTENGAQALAAWQSGDYAMLLTDLQMPEVDGYELARRLRDSEPAGTRAPIIALSANTLMNEEENCLAAGMDAYLSKPIALEDLQAALARWIPPAR